MSRCTSRLKKRSLSSGGIAVGLLLGAARVVQEDEIEIGAVAELEPRELAVADDGEAGLARRRAAARRAVFRDELAPRGAQRVVEHELCRVGQPIADFHQRQRAQPVGNGDAEDRRALEHADRVEHRFDVASAAPLKVSALEQRCELLARRRRVEHAVRRAARRAAAVARRSGARATSCRRRASATDRERPGSRSASAR